MEQIEQSNKGHKRNEKLDKKRKKEKDLKKIKKLKKKAYDLIRDDKRGEFFAQKNKSVKINRVKALKSFKKFLKIYKDDLEDFFDLFQQLDDGCIIETASIEDTEIRKKLEKLFKRLMITNESKAEPKFKKQHEYKLQAYVRGMFDEVVHGVQWKSSDESSQSRSRSRSSSKEPIKKPKQEVKILYARDQINIDEKPKVEYHQPLEGVRDKILEGYEPKKKYQPESMEFAIDKMFSAIDPPKGKLSQFLDSREKPMQQTKVKAEANGIYLGAAPQKKMTQEEQEEFMRAYDQQYRSKTLLEIHQEKMLAQKKPEKKDTRMRKDFNRETDLGGGVSSGQEMIQQMRQKGALSGKFSQGTLQNSFI